MSSHLICITIFWIQLHWVNGQWIPQRQRSCDVSWANISQLFSIFPTLCILVWKTVSNSKPHQEIIPPSFSLGLNFYKHLCSHHRRRFQWRRWLWQCSLHRHLNWIPQQSQLTVANSSQQVFNTISYIILSTCFDHFEAQLPYLSQDLPTQAEQPFRCLLHMSIAFICRHLSIFNLYCLEV